MMRFSRLEVALHICIFCVLAFMAYMVYATLQQPHVCYRDQFIINHPLACLKPHTTLWYWCAAPSNGNAFPTCSNTVAPAYNASNPFPYQPHGFFGGNAFAANNINLST
jgi:hypothetical protein